MALQNEKNSRYLLRDWKPENPAFWENKGKHTLTPKFPNPPLIPRALPCLAFGKKKLILPMLEAKFAPAKPHSKAITINIPKGVFGFCTAIPSQTQGIIRIAVLKTVHRRPPNIGTIKE